MHSALWYGEDKPHNVLVKKDTPKHNPLKLKLKPETDFSDVRPCAVIIR